MNLVLLGQPELADRLNDALLSQFKQRVILRCSLDPLSLESTASYIASRVRVAGGVAGQVFTRDAVRAIYEASRGIPRTIGVVCENALIAGFAAQKKPVDRAIVADVCRDLDLAVSGPAVREVAAAPAQDVAAAPRDVAGPAREVAAPESPADEETQPRRTASRRWFSSRSKESPPESTPADDQETPVVEERRRMFNFF